MSKTFKLLLVFVLFGVITGLFVAGQAFSATNRDAAATGKFVAVAPDIVLNTATGEARNSAGLAIVPAVEPGGTTVGKYSASGYIVNITTSATLTALGRSDIYSRLLKGISVVDTTTGRLVVNQRIYYNEPVAPSDIQ